MTGVAALRGMHCKRCGFTSATVQQFGCERCGSFGDQLAEIVFEGRGVVLASVKVSEHPNKEVAVPVTIGSVQLTEGPVVRARLDPECEVGRRVHATEPDGILVFAGETPEGSAS